VSNTLEDTSSAADGSACIRVTGCRQMPGRGLHTPGVLGGANVVDELTVAAGQVLQRAREADASTAITCPRTRSASRAGAAARSRRMIAANGENRP
jgi:hypothetical protein